MQEDVEPISVQYTVQSGESQNYTVEQLEKILRVKRRQIFNYAKIICDLHHWEPEENFKPDHGKFSTRMLAEMRRLQSLGADEYRLSVGRENHRPVALNTPSAVLAVVEDCSEILDTRISNLQQTAIANSEALADQLRAKLEEIKRQNVLARQQSAILSDAELLAAQNRGYLKAIKIYQVQAQAEQTALAQLQAMQLEEQ